MFIAIGSAIYYSIFVREKYDRPSPAQNKLRLSAKQCSTQNNNPGFPITIENESNNAYELQNSRARYFC